MISTVDANILARALANCHRAAKLLALAVPLFGLTVPTNASASRPVCPPTFAFNTNIKELKGYRVVLGKDGDSEVLPYHIDVRKVPLLKTGKVLGVIDLPPSPNRDNQLFIGPANVLLPLHSPPYKEMFILLGGSLTFKTAKFSAPMKPGSVLLFEDVGASRGHGAQVGPCGYVSLSIQPPAS